MTRSMRVKALLCLSSLLGAAGVAQATDYSLWINGRNGNGVVGNYNDFRYFGAASVAAGVNKKSVNWDGYNGIASQSGRIRNALDCFCTGTNWCYIATHSAGDMILGYTLAQFGGSDRPLSNPAAVSSSGVCGAAGTRVQKGWNIKWVRSAASSAGGSELADVGRWTTGEPLVHEHKVTRARALYNHNETRDVQFYMYAGAQGGLASGVLPGQDDDVVAYHSSGAVAGSSGGTYCNPRDWFCNDLTLGAGANGGGRAKWHNHSVVFRDDRERYGHYISGNWQGITAVLRADMEKFAR
jgi:hypothetical protein